MIVDHDNQRVLEVLENREKATVLAYLRQAKERGLLVAVKEVTTDMWDAYVEAARDRAAASNPTGIVAAGLNATSVQP